MPIRGSPAAKGQVSNERQIIYQFPFPITARLPRSSKMPGVRRVGVVGSLAQIGQENADQRGSEAASVRQGVGELQEPDERASG